MKLIKLKYNTEKIIKICLTGLLNVDTLVISHLLRMKIAAKESLEKIAALLDTPKMVISARLDSVCKKNLLISHFIKMQSRVKESTLKRFPSDPSKVSIQSRIYFFSKKQLEFDASFIKIVAKEMKQLMLTLVISPSMGFFKITSCAYAKELKNLKKVLCKTTVSQTFHLALKKKLPLSLSKTKLSIYLREHSRGHIMCSPCVFRPILFPLELSLYFYRKLLEHDYLCLKQMDAISLDSLERLENIGKE